MTWSSKINATFYPIIEKLAELYFMVQYLSIPHFCLQVENIANLDFYIVAFSDVSIDFSTACVYVISLHRFLDTCKVQLIMTSSKIQNVKMAESIMMVPQNETFGG